MLVLVTEPSRKRRTAREEHTAHYLSATGSAVKSQPIFPGKVHDPNATTDFVVKDGCVEFDVN